MRESTVSENECSLKVCMILTPLVWERSNFHSSPAMEQALDAALEVSGVTKDEIDAFDIYS
jgi:hypothetical protein